MLTGVALALSQLPAELAGLPALKRRVYERGGEREVQFLLADAEPVLPTWHCGRLRRLPWGNRRGDSRALPRTGWARLATAEAGGWAGAEEVVIPAALGLDGGVWFAVREGVRGLAAADGRGHWRVYPLCEPASHYYQVMTRSAWMPCLVGERI